MQLRPGNIYLIGMMGVGKSTVGKLLAEKLDYSFFDTDVEVMKLARKTVTQIFDTEGEEKFRQIESQALKEVSDFQKRVIATGGGIVTRPENWKYLHPPSTIWLNADLNLLHQRVDHDINRPLAGQLDELFSERRRYYEQAEVKIKIKSEHAKEDIVKKIIEKL